MPDSIGPIPPMGGYPSFDGNDPIQKEAVDDLTHIMTLMAEPNWQVHWPEIAGLVADLRANCLGHLPPAAEAPVRMVINTFPSHLDPTDPPEINPAHIATLLQAIMAALGKLHS